MKTSRALFKCFALFTFVAGLTTIAHAAEEVPVPNIEFLNKTYALAWRSDSAPHYSKTEYLPADEALPYYHNMLLVEKVSGVSVTDAVRAQVEFLKQPREGLAGARILNLIENPGTQEVLLVFALNAPDAEREMITEWNAYRYSPYTGVDGQAGVRLFGHSVRHYGNDASVYDFMEEIDIDNPQSARVNAVARANIPD